MHHKHESSLSSKDPKFVMLPGIQPRRSPYPEEDAKLNPLATDHRSRPYWIWAKTTDVMYLLPFAHGQAGRVFLQQEGAKKKHPDFDGTRQNAVKMQVDVVCSPPNASDKNLEERTKTNSRMLTANDPRAPFFPFGQVQMFGVGLLWLGRIVIEFVDKSHSCLSIPISEV
jgi:hypothetical protein